MIFVCVFNAESAINMKNHTAERFVAESGMEETDEDTAIATLENDIKILDEEIYEQRQDTIHAKGFDMYSSSYAMPEELKDDDKAVAEFNKIKVGVKQLEDAILDLGTLRLPRVPFCNKRNIMRAIVEKDYRKIRMISDFFYATSGIYQTVCNYFAYLYRYDWYIYPENVKESAKPEKVIEEYTKMLSYLDGTYIKKLCGDVALNVVKHGCYYGYIVDTAKGARL